MKKKITKSIKKKGKKKKEITPKRPSKPNVIQMPTSSGDLVDVQVSINPYGLPKGMIVPKHIYDEALRRWAKTGEQPNGMEIKINRWRNPERNRAKLTRWRYPASQEEARRTLQHIIERGEFTF